MTSKGKVPQSRRKGKKGGTHSPRRWECEEKKTIDLDDERMTTKKKEDLRKRRGKKNVSPKSRKGKGYQHCRPRA